MLLAAVTRGATKFRGPLLLMSDAPVRAVQVPVAWLLTASRGRRSVLDENHVARRGGWRGDRIRVSPSDRRHQRHGGLRALPGRAKARELQPAADDGWNEAPECRGPHARAPRSHRPAATPHALRLQGADLRNPGDGRACR